MIIGVGVDIIEIKRIKRAIERNKRFLLKIYSEKELEELKKKNIESYAGYFSAKEAVSKALGTGILNFKWTDIEIVKENSAPKVVLNNNAKKIAEQKGIKRIHISISHSREYATAFAVAEG
ncbi:holo-ACP synthase [Caloramator australicus]|uniref:Holo-[acyl-carrier-protein] synthase n=1 Tax=Caloramator australicus RC3 TaxID=857293 RepID=I7J5S2_9CLOT|nr:holo-ACP synthase [Caloramator australicus]CCJ33972.1 Holo-[acyl-carrier protein] synthase [Caloramator australicus RC3]